MIEEKEKSENRNHAERGQSECGLLCVFLGSQDQVCETKEQHDPSCSRGRTRRESISAEVQGPKHWGHKDNWNGPAEYEQAKRPPLLRNEAHVGSGKKETDKRHGGEDVAGQLGFGDGEEYETEDDPANGEERGVGGATLRPHAQSPMEGGPDQRQGPWGEGDEEYRNEKPARLDVLEFGGEVAFEIVLDDEDAEEIGIATGTKDVPGEGGKTEAGNGYRVEAAEGVTPASGECRPQQNATAGKNDGGGTLRERGEAEEKAEENQGEPRRSLDGRRLLVAGEAQDDGRKDQRNGERAGEGHVRGGGVRKADHAHGGGKKKQQPARGPRTIDTPGQPRHGQGSEQRREGAGKTRRGIGYPEEFEAERRAPV